MLSIPHNTKFDFSALIYICFLGIFPHFITAQFILMNEGKSLQNRSLNKCGFMLFHDTWSQ